MFTLFKIENLSKNGYLVHQIKSDMSLDFESICKDHRLERITKNRDYFKEVRKIINKNK